uniref:DNA_MISMATCH_REPAIR_2 domain-containing protein n=1 Tax=Strongyloides papillosus TaxID=174720 RepID=A0A0N5C6Z6_STREA
MDAGDGNLNETVKRILKEKPPNTAYIFENKGHFYLYGDDAILVSEEIFENDNLMDYIKTAESEEAVARYPFIASEYESVVWNLLVRLQHSVKHFTIKEGSEWSLLYEGTPSAPNDFELIAGGAGQLTPLCSTVFVKFINSVHSNGSIEVAYCNTKNYTISTFELQFGVNFQHLGHIITILDVKEVLAIKENLEAGENILEKFESFLHRVQVPIRFVREEEIQKIKEAKDVITRMASNSQEINQLSDSSIINLYVLLENMKIIKDFSNQTGLLCYQKYSFNDFVVLDPAAVEALELFSTIPKSYYADNSEGTVFKLLNYCRTSSGSRLLEEWLRRPLVRVNMINERQDIVEALRNEPSVKNFLHESFLPRVPDCISISRRLIIKKGTLRDCVEIFQLAEDLYKLSTHFEQLVSMSPNCEKSIHSVLLKPLEDVKQSLHNFVDFITKVIDVNTLTSGNYKVVPDFDKSLSEINDLLKKLESEANKEFESVRRGIDDPSLNIECGENGFTMTINLSGTDLVNKPKYKYTVLRNTEERGVVFVTDLLKEINKEYVKYLKDYKERELSYVEEVLKMAYENTPTINSMLDFVAQLDVFVSFAVFATSTTRKFVRPQILDHTNIEEERVLTITKLRHPVVEASPNVDFIPNDIKLSSNEGVGPRFVLITGANMGGKSTFSRSVALCVLLGQIGCPVPCDEARYTAVDGIFTRIGDRDYPEVGIPTFMNEMLDCANIIYGATPNSLVVVDTIGHGVSTFEGTGLAYAIAEEIIERKCFTLYTTYYTELKELKDKFPHIVQCLRSDYGYTEDGELISSFKMIPGVAEKSSGIELARRLGLPEDFLQMASKYYEEFSKLGQD